MKDIIKTYGRGYYRATFLFPRSIREATWIYYTFVRLPDEIVDGAIEEDRAQRLQVWKEQWKGIVAGKGEIHNEACVAFKGVMDEYHIPAEYSFSFLEAMEQDLTKAQYQTYTDLEAYMYGSAVVVGYTMSHIIGFEEGALPYARALGEAFQMTNFLRDIREDYEVRGRVYIPQEDLDRYGVTIDHIREHRCDEAWRALMRFEMARTRALYATGIAGIARLHPRGRRAVYAAARIYKEILDNIENNNYDIFSRRIVVSPFRKTVLLCKALWKRNL